MTPKMKYKVGDVIFHLSDPATIGLVVETMEAYRTDDIIRLMSGNQYQIYWTIHPAGDSDLDECWYPEEHINRIEEELKA